MATVSPATASVLAAAVLFGLFVAAVSLGSSAVEIAESVGGFSGAISPADVVSSFGSSSLADSVVATGFSGSDVRVVSESVVTGLSVVVDVISVADSVAATGGSGSDVRVVSESVVTGLSVVVVSAAESVVATGFSGSDVRVVADVPGTDLSVVINVFSIAESVVEIGSSGSDMRVVSESVVTGLSVVVDVVSAVTVLSSTGVPVITSLLAVGLSEVAALFEGSGESDVAPVRVSASDDF